MRTPPSSAGAFYAGLAGRCAACAVIAAASLLAASACGELFEPPLIAVPFAEEDSSPHTPEAQDSEQPAEPGSIEPAQYLEESLTHEDIRQEIDRAVDARLAGIPRPRYIPATDLAPPKGLLLATDDPRRGEFPFSLALGGYLQVRWLEFARSATQWTDSAGNPREVNNINTFNLNRFLISMSGHVVDERLVYSFAFFGTSDAGLRSGIVPIGMAGWKFSDAATVGAGVTIVPASREWVGTTPWTIGIDRSMVNTFFRPGFSPGVQSIGSLFDNTVHYQGGVWNAIDGGTSGSLRRGTSMAFAGNTWWEPLGSFGLGYGDMECRDDPVIRLGTSGTYGRTRSLGFVGQNPEDTIVRLSDGTPLALPDALGPNSRIDQFVYQLATVDAGWKYGGVAVNFEYYFRMLNDFSGVGSFERSSVFDHGGLGYVSWCFVPRTCEAYARSSALTGPYGTGQEYGGGLNWYVNQSRQGRLTLEALHMNRNPAQNILYPYRAGASGTAIQTQFMVTF